MTGVPWALDELPRQLHPNPVGDIFGAPPVRKTRIRKPKDLPTINERPGHAAPKSPLSQRQDAAASTTDLRTRDRDIGVTATVNGTPGHGNSNGHNTGHGNGNEDGDAADGAPRKVQKGQINALAKMLSMLRV